MTPQERATKIYDYIQLQFDEDPTYDMIDSGVALIADEIQSAVEEALTKRDLEQFGESFMLNGKRIGPHEIYKSTTDYVREARAEALEEAAKVAELHITNRLGGIYGDGYDAATMEISRSIRSRIPKLK